MRWGTGTTLVGALSHLPSRHVPSPFPPAFRQPIRPQALRLCVSASLRHGAVIYPGGAPWEQVGSQFVQTRCSPTRSAQEIDNLSPAISNGAPPPPPQNIGLQLYAAGGGAVQRRLATSHGALARGRLHPEPGLLPPLGIWIFLLSDDD